VANESILVIEDEEDILELISVNLQRSGYRVSASMTGEDGLNSARKDVPDLIILDLMLPGIEGLDVCRLLKSEEHTQVIPIIMLTARGEEADIVAGLEVGAHDYITKPFSTRVLTARVRAILRRKTVGVKDDVDSLRIHDLVINPGRHEVLADGKSVVLTPTEFQILHYIARRPGWVFTRNQIIEGIREDNTIVTDRSVDVQIAGLRKKLGKLGNYIETVRGIGYRFKE